MRFNRRQARTQQRRLKGQRQALIEVLRRTEKRGSWRLRSLR